MQCQKITYFSVAKNKFPTDTESNMAKVRIKSDKIIPFGGIFSIIERFKSSARSCAPISAEARARRRSLTIYLKKHTQSFCSANLRYLIYHVPSYLTELLEKRMFDSCVTTIIRSRPWQHPVPDGITQHAHQTS